MERLNLNVLNNGPDHLFRCEFCGSHVPSYNADSGFCYFCELNVNSLDETLRHYPDFYDALNLMGEGIIEAKWEDAEKGLQKLMTLRKSPEMSYVAGVFYKAYSDYMYADRDYDYLGGFREQNAMNINSGIALFYKSKAMFYQAIADANKDLQADNKNESKLFVRFMSETKLKRMVDASATLKELNVVSKGVKSAYASMVYSSTMNDKRSATFMKQLADIGIINSFYYYAKLLADENRLSDAKKMLLRLLSRANVPAAKSLLDGIQEAQEII